MPRGYLALVIELHHPLPGPGQEIGESWPKAAVEYYWPLLNALTRVADAGLAEVVTLAVSPSWTALAADSMAQALTRAEFDRRANADLPHQEKEKWHSLRQVVVDRWASDPLLPLRHVFQSAAVELIPTAASHTWLPAVVDDAIVARAQVGLAADDHALKFGRRAEGMWLPFLAYRPDLERTLARFRLRYFGVDAHSFRRGTVRPPSDVFGPLVSPPGVAAFGVSPEPTALVVDPDRRYARDPRYDDPSTSQVAASAHASHFVATWREWAESRAPRDSGPPPISVIALSAHHLAGSWRKGPEWLECVLLALVEAIPWSPTTPGRFLDRYPEAPLGRPGPSAGGWLSARPGGSDLFARCRDAAETVADLVGCRDQLGPQGRRALAHMVRSLLLAQRVDWDVVPHASMSAEMGLEEANRHLARVAELSGCLTAGCVEALRLSALEHEPAYLPQIDPDILAEP